MNTALIPHEPQWVSLPRLSQVIDTRPILQKIARTSFKQALGRPIFYGGTRIGVIHESPEATYCFLKQVAPEDPGATRGEQTVSIFRTIERVLQAEGMEFEHLVRTWFYLDKILDWYDEFNQARTPFLEARGAFDRLVPASTGIGIGNQFGTAAVAGALAIKPKGPKATIIEVASPLQCSALAYKSSFSRAVEVARDGLRELYISGTASIDPAGLTAHVGDPQRQIELTMDVVAEILKSRAMNWSHCTRAIAYFKHPEYASIFAAYLRQHGLEQMPMLAFHADVCRDDLLFELELDALDADGL